MGVYGEPTAKPLEGWVLKPMCGVLCILVRQGLRFPHGLVQFHLFPFIAGGKERQAECLLINEWFSAGGSRPLQWSNDPFAGVA